MPAHSAAAVCHSVMRGAIAVRVGEVYGVRQAFRMLMVAYLVILPPLSLLLFRNSAGKGLRTENAFY